MGTKIYFIDAKMTINSICMILKGHRKQITSRKYLYRISWKWRMAHSITLYPKCSQLASLNPRFNLIKQIPFIKNLLCLQHCLKRPVPSQTICAGRDEGETKKQNYKNRCSNTIPKISFNSPKSHTFYTSKNKKGKNSSSKTPS